MTLFCAKCDAPGTGTLDALPEGWEKHTSTMFAEGFPVCPACVGGMKSSSKASGDAGSDRYRLFIERIERLEEEKAGIGDDISDVYAEMKATGYDTKVTREIIKRRKMDGHTLREFEALLETYKAALGMD